MEDWSGLLYDEDSEQSDMGHSESKAKRREKSGNGNSKQTRGVATSFGFRRRPASTSRADESSRRKQAHDKNGNGGSSEDLRVDDVLSGRSTPLARPRKDAVGHPLRTNRFGFRQSGGTKTAKVGDVSSAAEHAFNAPHKDVTSNNNGLDKRHNQLPSTHVPSSTFSAVSGAPKTLKQTVILTYQPQQCTSQEPRCKGAIGRLNESQNPRTNTYRSQASTSNDVQKNGKFTLLSNQLPRPQYPSVKIIDTKSAKQVANNTRKIAHAVDGWREGASSAVSVDSGVWTAGEGTAGGAKGSPPARRRPRNLEMVMRGTHNFHLRELQVADLDIMDDALVTEHVVIPLPKLPSSFDDAPSFRAPTPTYNPISSQYSAPTSEFSTSLTVASKVNKPAMEPIHTSHMSTLDRYRVRNRPTSIEPRTHYKDEEKFVLDRLQKETLNKQNSFIKSSSGVVSPITINSSKESSPSCKSEESNFGHNDTWQTHAAGEAMATRSQDDVSIALSISSCEDDKSKQDTSKHKVTATTDIPKKMIVIMDDPPVPHPLLMKSLTLSQHDSLLSNMMGSITSSNYSTTSTSTNISMEQNNLTLTLDEPKFDLSALEISTQSLLDDETSPADSLISSTSTSGSNNDLHIEKEALSISSSAYQTANTKTRSTEPAVEEYDNIDGEAPPSTIDMKDDSNGCSKNASPATPGTPTHASGSLSLSDGRDFFDDEIADQPALLFRKSSEGNTVKAVIESEANKVLRRSRDKIINSPLAVRNKKLCGRNGGAERTPSLDTLSSLASDDLMMEGDLGRSITSLQSVDDYIERLDSSLRSGLNSFDEKQLRQELSTKSSSVRQWSQLLEQSQQLDRQLAAVTQTDSIASSNNSLTSIGASLPVRTARLLQRSRAQTPSDVTASENASPTPAPALLLQDVVDIKTLLLQLKRVLQEPGEVHHSMSSETLDPLQAACAESPARGNGRRLPPASPLHPDACADLRRQILYLQSQLEERDRLVRVLQQQMLRMTEGGASEARSDDTCNVATQTDRLRPLSTALNSESSGLVSWNEQVNGTKLPIYSDSQKAKRSLGNGTYVKCLCGAQKLNGLTIKETDSEKYVANGRIGTKYLQAVATSKTEPSAKTKRFLQAPRSRSIENFQHQYGSIDENIAKNVVFEESTSPVKHCTSFGDLYNGRVGSRESVFRGSPTLQNGQSTDTDYSSDGGYKSLPSSINCNGRSPRKVSGIPRRSIEQKFLSSKHNVKASAV